MSDLNTYFKGEFGSLVGKTIAMVRALTPDENIAMGWEADEEGFVLVCEDGTAIIPMRDPEGNGAGFLALADVSVKA